MRPWSAAAAGPAGLLMRAWPAVAVAGALVTLAAALAARRIFALVTVTGDSMWPALAQGDRVLVRRARLGQLRRGQVVVLESPGTAGYAAAPPGVPGAARVAGREWIIKRVAAVPGDRSPADSLPATADPRETVPPGTFVVLGDNAAWSYDSRQIGYIPGERLLGIVVRQVGAGGDQPPARRPPTPAASGAPRSV